MAYCGLDGMKISKTELKRHVESPIVDNISLHCRSLHDVFYVLCIIRLWPHQWDLNLRNTSDLVYFITGDSSQVPPSVNTKH